MQIDDGYDTTISCTGHVNEATCHLMEGHKVLNFGDVAVGIRTDELQLKIKNDKRTIAIYHIIEAPSELLISEEQGIIKTDAHAREIKCSFCSQIEKTFNETMKILIRGGNTLEVPVKANVIVPRLSIMEEAFDFGGVILGNSQTLILTIVNDSQIPASVLIDLRAYEDEFQLSLPTSHSMDEDVLIHVKDDQDEDDQEPLGILKFSFF